MIQSMTGYGKATVELPDKKINVEIKSLNSKAMDLSARIAPLYREKEMEIRNEISRKLERGKVDFSLWIEKKESAESVTPINQTLVEGYYKQICAISENLGIPVPDATDWFATLLRMPDVMTKNDTQELSEEEWAVVYSAVGKGCWCAWWTSVSRKELPLKRSSVRRSPTSPICWRLSLPMRKSV